MFTHNSQQHGGVMGVCSWSHNYKITFFLNINVQTNQLPLCRLPFPWLIYNIIHDFKAVEVSSNGLFCAIVLLFLMLLFVIASIAACKWKMSKFLGFLMFLLYFVFLVVSVMLEDKVLVCPVTIWGRDSRSTGGSDLLQECNIKLPVVCLTCTQ